MGVEGALCSSGEEIQTQNFNIYIINEVMEQALFHIWMNKLFSEENKVPRTLFEGRKVAGSATYKQNKTVWSCVILWGQIVHSILKTKSVFI